MYLPRRFRRRLLLPPGWVALGFLLLLGCLMIRTQWRQLQLVTVLQITMPPVKPDTAILAFYKRHGLHGETPYDTPYQSVKELEKLRPWHRVDIDEEPLTTFFNFATIETYILAINADSAHAGGVRIQFRTGAKYASLVKVLDIMNVTNQKKYWLDNRHQQIVLYAITDKKPPQNIASHPVTLLGCCVCGPYPVKLIQPGWLSKVESLGKLVWRPSLLLLLIISILTGRRLWSHHKITSS